MKQRLQYGTWIRSKKVFAFWTLAAALLCGTFFAILIPWFLLLLIPALIFAYIALIVTLTRWRFSSRGSDFQNKIHDLMLTYRTKPGSTIDIGCGNGNLIIKVAKADRSSSHLGLDSWGRDWEYSIEQCEVNARLEEADNVEFVKGSAARTGLDNDRYACVLSCLTFHEVHEQPEKALMVAEALRVLQPGGTYVFLDLFDDKRHYPSLQGILRTIELAGCSIRANTSLSELISLPFPLTGRNALRYARLLSGEKTVAG